MPARLCQAFRLLRTQALSELCLGVGSEIGFAQLGNASKLDAARMMRIEPDEIAHQRAADERMGVLQMRGELPPRLRKADQTGRRIIVVAVAGPGDLVAQPDQREVLGLRGARRVM